MQLDEKNGTRVWMPLGEVKRIFATPAAGERQKDPRR
jgi:hypothetical protein